MAFNNTKDTNSAPAFSDYKAKSADIEAIRTYLGKRVSGLEFTRAPYLKEWKDLADHFLPLHGRFTRNPNDTGKISSYRSKKILDSAPVLAARLAATGFLRGLTNPGTPWLTLTTATDEEGQYPIKVWLSKVQDIVLQTFSKAGLYVELEMFYLELVVFGTAVMLILEDEDSFVRFDTLTAGEYFIAVGPKNEIDTLYREFPLTKKQIADRFGVANTTPQIQSAIANQTGLDAEVMVCHMVEVNSEFGKVKGARKFRSLYWERDSQKDKLLSLGYLDYFPAVATQMIAIGNDPYGYGCGSTALPDTRSFYRGVSEKAKALERMVNPPMAVHESSIREQASLIPGAVNILEGGPESGIRPIVTVVPNAIEMWDAHLEGLRNNIRNAFYNNLFQPMEQLQTVRSALEVSGRQTDAANLVGPVVERSETQVLGPLVQKVFDILVKVSEVYWAFGIPEPPLPLPPEDMKDLGSFQVTYLSPLSQAQRSLPATSLIQTMSAISSLAQFIPEALDNINGDNVVEELIHLSNISPAILRPKDEVDQIRQQRQQQQEEQQQADRATQLAGAYNQAGQGAKNIGPLDPSQVASTTKQLFGVG